MRGIEGNPTENVSQFQVCGRHYITHLGGDPIERDGGAACSGLFSTGTKELSPCERGASLLAVVGEIWPSTKFPSGHFDTGCSKYHQSGRADADICLHSLRRCSQFCVLFG